MNRDAEFWESLAGHESTEYKLTDDECRAAFEGAIQALFKKGQYKVESSDTPMEEGQYRRPFYGRGLAAMLTERPGTLAYEHRTDAALRLNGPDTQDAIQRVLEWSASTPVWKANWVPEFSAMDAELMQRSLGVILDESRLHWPGTVDGAGPQ